MQQAANIVTDMAIERNCGNQLKIKLTGFQFKKRNMGQNADSRGLNVERKLC